MRPYAVVRHADSGRWLRFVDPVAVLCARSSATVAEVIESVEARCRDDGLYAVGFLTYEAAPGLDPKLTTHPPGRLPPAWFALFRAPQVRAPQAVSMGAAPVADAPLWQADLDRAAYLRAVCRVREHIARGDTYQVNFSYRLNAAADAGAAAALFRQMSAAQPGGYGALLECDAWAICSASPELFFAHRPAPEVSGSGRVCSRPMKGTAARGPDAVSDAARARWLAGSVKNRAENLMITDMVRNDIGRIARTGSVRTEALFQLERHPTVWQMTSTVCGASDAPLLELLRALFPAASITGAPKRHTMNLIRSLESSPREIYTGSIGLIEPGGAAQFNVAIRTAWLDKARGCAQYGVGGGIVWDSVPQEEYAETVAKARVVREPAAPPFALLETLLWEPDRGYLLLDAHLDRLNAAARYFDRPLDRADARRRLEALAATFAHAAQRVRVLLQPDASLELESAPLAGRSAPRKAALVRAELLNDPFVYHKTTHRQVYQRALDRARARHADADEAILVNERGEVTESTIANVVADLNGTLVTPPVASGLLNGVYRQHLVASGAVSERILTPADLLAARRVYLVNSLRRRWPITILSSERD